MGMPDSAVVVMATMGSPAPGDQAHATERARLFLAAGRPDLAIVLCDSIDADQNPEARLICSSALAAAGRVGDAAEAYLSTAAAAECHERTLDECYESLLRLARPDAASEVANRAMNCPGAHGAWATRRAYALVAAGRLDEAESVLEDRWRREPADVAALDLLSSVVYRRGRLGRAESLLRRGVEAFPEVPSLRRRLAGLYRDGGRIADAMRILVDEAGAEPDTTTAALLMAGWTSAGFPDRAVAQAVAIPLSGGDMAFQAAAAWERLACVRRSASAFEEILRRDPQQGQSCNYLGYMLAERGFQLARAETLVQCALRVEPDNPYYLDSLGWVYYRQGRLSDSVQLLRRALALDPAESEVMKHLGIALIHSGASEEGMTLLRRAAADRPWDMELRAVLKDAIP
jgi:predicted Zn-dependent protease